MESRSTDSCVHSSCWCGETTSCDGALELFPTDICDFFFSPILCPLSWNVKWKVEMLKIGFTNERHLNLLLFPSFRRLAKSTLLLIPLFGINFIVFAFIPEQVKTELRLIFDLILGSFQVWSTFKIFWFFINMFVSWRSAGLYDSREQLCFHH